MPATLALLLTLSLPDALLPRWDGAAPPAAPTVLLARAGSLLLGTESGLYERRGASRAWRLVLARDDVRDLAPIGSGALVASGGRLFEWSAEQQGAREVSLGAGAEAGGVAIDSRGTAWVASAAGLYRRDAGAREFERESGVPPGELLAVASAGETLWFASDGALWSGSRERGFTQRVSGLEPGWWELCGAVERPDATLLCVPSGIWRVDADGGRRIEIGAGRLHALSSAAGAVFAAGEGGLYVFPPGQPISGAGRQELSVPAYGLAVSDSELLVATERGIAAFALSPAAHAPRPRPPAADEGADPPSMRIAPARSRASQIQQLQRAALAYLELSPSRLTEIEQRSRRTGYLPELRASLFYDRDRSRDAEHDQVFSSGNFAQLFDSGSDRSHGYDIGMTLVWDFAELASPDEALAISRERRSLVTLRDQVLERVNHLYFGRLRLLAQLEALDPSDAARRAELELDAAEIAAQLDAWSGGLFSRLDSNSPPATQREP